MRATVNSIPGDTVLSKIVPESLANFQKRTARIGKARTIPEAPREDSDKSRDPLGLTWVFRESICRECAIALFATESRSARPQ